VQHTFPELDVFILQAFCDPFQASHRAVSLFTPLVRVNVQAHLYEETDGLLSCGF
jgi:hypothetical protein